MLWGLGLGVTKALSTWLDISNTSSFCSWRRSEEYSDMGPAVGILCATPWAIFFWRGSGISRFHWSRVWRFAGLLGLSPRVQGFPVAAGLT